MSDELSARNLKDDLEKVLASPAAKRWEIEHADLLVIWATLAPEGHDQDRYQAQLAWREYPGKRPSLKFRDPGTGRLDMPTAWPKASGLRPASLDSCMHWTEEGVQIHPEWANDANTRWNSHGNPLLRCLGWLQHILDTSYQGRFNG